MLEDKVLISLQNVSMSYSVKVGMLKWEKFTPLNNISFDVHSGETIGVIGSNGTGKSTLLRLIAGIIKPDTGCILNYDAHVSLLSLGLGFVQRLNGRQNVMLSGMLLGQRRSQIAKKMDKIIELSGLGHFIDQPLDTYSSGMRARLGFSVAVQVKPDVLLIDEVLGVGDEAFRAKSAAEIKKMINSDRTVVLVSHNMASVKEMCDRVVWIENKTIQSIGDTEEILESYRNHSNT